MTEPQPDARGPQPAPEAAAPVPPVAPGEAGQSVVNAQAGPSDDAPTIISRTQPHRGARPEDAFISTLRGRRLAHYELIEPIGVGGMAAVIRARDTQLDRSVALKILPPEMAADPEVVRRFQQEARAAAKLDHENIARVFFCGEDQGLNFISFEFVDGENLRTLLDRRGRLPVPEAVHYMLQIATGLAHACARGVVHRDIKPSNIIISPNGRAKLVDMGLARSLDPHSDNGLTQSGVTLGTFDYISPEQALEPREADVRSDIYSLGCTFYHMLTGQGPVPEGTAAKKLHHHQHVAPVDPRQLNPDIPDEVAAILARMMAKDPKDRYQRPEHLVQHLLQLAQKLGDGTEVPDGVLFVDAPLPSPPRMRPMLVGVAAVLILVALVVLNGMAPGPAPAPASAGRDPATGDQTTGVGPGPARDPWPGTQDQEPQPRSAPPASHAAQFRVHDARGLIAALARADVDTQVLLEGNIDLNLDEPPADAEQTPGLFYHGREHELTIQPSKPGLRPTIRLKYDTRGGDKAWTALTVEGGKVQLRGLRFEVDAASAPDRAMVAVRLQNSGLLDIQNCEFVQVRPPTFDRYSTPARDRQGWQTSVVIEGARGNAVAPVLHCQGCYFSSTQEAAAAASPDAVPSQAAVQVAGRAGAVFTDCAFAPHATLFHLRNRTAATSLVLRHCSALLADGTVFQVDEDTPCRLAVFDCLFSHPQPETAGTVPLGSATLVRHTGDTLNLTYDGRGNRYHNLTTFWLRAAPDHTEKLAATWDEFKGMINEKSTDTQSVVLAASPWADKDPLPWLTNQPARAFRLSMTAPELREVEQPKLKMVGVGSCTWGKLYPGRLPELPDKPPELLVATKVVDPNATARDSANGIYPKLSQAVLAAKPGDVILIRHTGQLRIEPVVLEQATCNLTIRPDRGYRPVLTLADTTELGASLFRLHDGQLHLERLQFLLKPAQTEFKAQAVVTVAGVGECVFKNCVITLDTEDAAEGVRLAAVALADPADFKKMGGASGSARESARVALDGCFVRGKGDLVAVRASRPFDLDIGNSLVALAGSFLNVKGKGKDVPIEPPVRVTLARSTAYLTGNLVLLQTDNDAKDLVRVEVASASHCLFTSAGGSKALVHFDGDLTDENKMKSRFIWKGDDNACSNFEQLVDQQSSEKYDMMPLQAYGKKKWLDDKQGPWFERKKVISPPSDDRLLTRVLPEDFKIKPDAEVDAQTYGPEIAQLPRPPEEGKSRPTDK